MAEKRKRGRPLGVRLNIPKHVFLDVHTAALLKRLAEAAGESESAFIRKLIRQQEAQ